MMKVVAQQVKDRQKNFAERALVNFRIAAKKDKDQVLAAKVRPLLCGVNQRKLASCNLCWWHAASSTSEYAPFEVIPLHVRSGGQHRY